MFNRPRIVTLFCGHHFLSSRTKFNFDKDCDIVLCHAYCFPLSMTKFSSSSSPMMDENYPYLTHSSIKDYRDGSCAFISLLYDWVWVHWILSCCFVGIIFHSLWVSLTLTMVPIATFVASQPYPFATHF